METDNLYMLFVFCVMRMRRTTCYTNITADIQAGATGFFCTATTLTLGPLACALSLLGANVLTCLAGFSPGRAFTGMSVWALVCTAPAREQLS